MQSIQLVWAVFRPADKPAGRAIAQRAQRGFAVENRARQALQTGADGQLRHTAHWLGSPLERLEKGF
jgi:hypothetical protein